MYPIPPQHIAFFAALPPDVVVDQTSQEWPRFQQIFTELTQKDPLVFRKEIVKNYPRALLEKAILEKLKNTQVPYFLTCQEIQLYTKKEDSRFVITMPFYKKGDLINKIIELNASYDKSAPQERLKKQKETLDYAYWVCKAVTHLHGLGILHRDLKPDNFLLNDENIPVLIDFECACFESSINPAPLETPEYSAPEGSYDRKSDIWSLGMSLFQILQPFWDETDPWLQELSKNWTSQNKKYVQSLEQIPPSTNPNPLAILINTMIEQDPRRRPEAFQVLDEITRIQASLHPEMPQ
jgi:serine/threonine protein kinase